MAALKLTYAGVVAGLMSLVLTGCASWARVAEFVSGHEDLSILASSLSATGLLDKNSTERTLFAPSNEAFAALDEKVFECLQNPVGLTTLAKVLEYHIVEGRVFYTDLSNGDKLKTLDGDKMLTVKIDGKTVMMEQATVTEVETVCGDGVVHIIDQVMIPSDFVAPNCGTGNIAETASVVDDLSTLVTALGLADLVDTVNGTDLLTVFAPTNDAFTALGDVGTCLLKPENKNALTKVLKYHVVSGYVLSTDITNGLEADTVDAPEKLTFSTKGGVKINGKATVTGADNYCTNGVVHIIDQVLIPANLKTTCIPASRTHALV